MFNLVDLSNKQIIVTGASSGIGKETAILLSKLGAKLILVARRESLLSETIAQLHGDGHSFYVFDLNLTNDIEALVKRIVAEHGPVDGLAYVAGTGKSVPLTQFSPEKIEAVFRINYFGFVEFVRQVSKKGRFNTGMRIVGVSSIASVCGDPAHTAYSGSKAALDGSIRCIAKELAPKGIAINSVAPAMTKTAMFEGFNKNYGENSNSGSYLLQRQYLGIGEPIDIANSIAFLISGAARFITGTCLFVDGGYTSC